MNNEEILKLAKECGARRLMSPVKHESLGLMGNDEIEDFYKAAFNAGIEAAADVADSFVHGTDDDPRDPNAVASEIGQTIKALEIDT